MFYYYNVVIDLHTHSNASDGTFSPTELVEHANKACLSVLALTDHDTISGLTEAEIVAKNFGIYFIYGIEFNIEVNLGEFHLLGYGMDISDTDFLELVAEGNKNRFDRNKTLCKMFFDAGIPITYELLQEKFSGQVGRPHFAKLLKELKIVKSIQEGFDKYLAVGRPFYLKTKGLDFKKAVSVIKKAGGVSVLAHPMSLYLSWGRLKTKITELQQEGLDAIEAWNSGTKPTYCRRLEKLAKSLNLAVTAGSDFHGKNKPNQLGIKSDGNKIEDYYYTENLLPLLKKSKSKL